MVRFLNSFSSASKKLAGILALFLVTNDLVFAWNDATDHAGRVVAHISDDFDRQALSPRAIAVLNPWRLSPRHLRAWINRAIESDSNFGADRQQSVRSRSIAHALLFPPDTIAAG